MEDDVYIGHFNLIWRLKKIELKSGSRISALNWITGAQHGTFRLGSNSSISVLHFFEASGNIAIGANSIIAGRSSQFFTHGITPENLNDISSIIIEDWCYIGSASRFVPGAYISNHTFVGMGAVVTKRFSERYVLIGGVPATIIKKLPRNAAYFERLYLPQSHQPPEYNGKP
ncbi:acyltransferase [Kordiimonas pumila]|uniref:Acyltransferase n=1 Tax=Kordiimonas pumila TaxID=2161677 RepID=A0ABV7D592_9PROT|nr:hypothetical protein [Kordiimonas pumila]